MTRRRKVLLLVSIPVLLIGCWAAFTSLPLSDLRDRLKYGRTQPVAEVIEANKKSTSMRGFVCRNTLVGQTKPQILGAYGKPNMDEPGYHSLGLYYPDTFPRGEMRTLIFNTEGWFLGKSGTQWVWLVEFNGEWICFESCWVAEGVQF